MIFYINTKEKFMETNEANYKNILKATITLFLSYGILIGFIFIVLILTIKYALEDMTSTPLSITLSLITGILLFYLLRFVCKSSTIESFKKAKLSEENQTRFLQKMNLLFTICIIISILICLSYLFINNMLFSNAIAQAYQKYEFISSEFTNDVILRINEEYQSSLAGRVLSTVIIELSLVISFFSLIPYQKKMLEKYNKSTD